MYVRDHMRPYMHEAFGIEPTEYDYKVFEITSEISKQIFPVTLDIDNPKFRAGLERMRVLMTGIEAAKKRGGVAGLVQRAGLAVAAAGVFAKLYFLPVKRHELPQQVRLAPAW
jgi:magnesium-protoporphyrin IX monomethyl ester (oxidative) cyclase